MKSMNHMRGLWRFCISRDCPSACGELNPAQDWTTWLGAVATFLWLIPMTRKGCTGLCVPSIVVSGWRLSLFGFGNP